MLQNWGNGAAVHVHKGRGAGSGRTRDTLKVCASGPCSQHLVVDVTHADAVFRRVETLVCVALVLELVRVFFLVALRQLLFIVIAFAHRSLHGRTPFDFVLHELEAVKLWVHSSSRRLEASASSRAGRRRTVRTESRGLALVDNVTSVSRVSFREVCDVDVR